MARGAFLFVTALSFVLAGAAPPPPGSAAKATRVHVKKSARTMTLYAGDEVLAKYDVAVGKGGPGPKRMEGDLVTPVGHYHVIKHEPSHLRIFLRLDYPNAEDRARFTQLMASGELPKSATIGGDIGIHGAPARPEWKPIHKTVDWTLGCVAVDDAEIDEIGSLVLDGTPVDVED